MKSILKNLQQRIIPSRHRQILYNQIVDEQQPGTILRDFGVLLEFVRKHAPLKVTSTYHLLPMKMLPQLNTAMSRPIKLDLKRPQHRSYPNILGLYLLLRATGLACIEGSGAKQRLVIDEEVLLSWNSLNPTEQYFMLLETALLRAEPEIIGDEYGGGFYNSLLSKWMILFQNLPNEEGKVLGSIKPEDIPKFFPGNYYLTLMQMFGLVTVQDGEPKPGKGWRILSIDKTPLGEAMLRELAGLIPKLEKNFGSFYGVKKEAGFGELQPIFQPFFPEWQQNLVIPEHDIQEGTYIFKVMVWKDVWRRIAIPGRMLLDRLSDVILDAFEFYDRCHLYRFIYTNRFGVEKHIDHPALHEGLMADNPSPLTNRVTVQEVPIHPGRSMIFFYDFGDCWQFNVLLEEIAPLDPTLRTPKIIEKQGRSPEQYGF